MNDYEMIYDGECPLCASGAALARVAPEKGRIRCTDARKHPARVTELAQDGLDLDTGLVVIRGRQRFHGAEALRQLAMAAPQRGMYNRVLRALFTDRRRATRVYPWFVATRNLLLKIRRRPFLADGSGA